MAWIDKISTGLVSGMIAGFAVLGVGGRIAMRLISIADGKPGRFSIGGTMFVCVIFSVFGLILSVPFATLHRYRPNSALSKGSTYGLLLTLIIVWALPLIPTLLDTRGDEAGFVPIVTRVLFSVLFLGYGVTVGSVSIWLDKIEARKGANFIS